MTVSSENVKDSYTGGVGQTVFNYTFKIYVVGDIRVFVDGTEVTSGFTVGGVGDEGGGTVTFDVSQDNSTVVFLSSIAFTQDTDLVRFGTFDAESVEAALDKLTRLDLQQEQSIAQSLKVDDSDVLDAPVLNFPATLSERASKVWIMNGAGDQVQLGNLVANGLLVVLPSVTGSDSENPVSDAGVADYVQSEIASGVFEPTVPLVTVLESGSGTHNFHADMKHYEAELIGGGGGGGGGAAGTNPCGGGGAAGGYSYGRYLRTASSATYAVGAAGGGAATDLDGTMGGNTTFDDGTESLTANGGGGGKSASNATISSGGSASGGQINISGQTGGLSGESKTSNFDGSGADSQLGIGGSFSTEDGAQKNATGYGAAGAGGIGNGSATIDESGGEASGGVIKITEWLFDTVANIPSERQVKYAHSSDAKYASLVGLINNSNDIFELPDIPVAGSILVHHNGFQTTDFTEYDLPNKQIQLGFVPRNDGPDGDDLIMVTYDKA